ncbi:MAG: hypothetical protein WCP32_10280 [Bacteroidota bacterium]
MKTILKHMQTLSSELETTIEKRTEEFEGRSEKWQESEKGEDFLVRTERLQEMLDELSQWSEELE